MPSSPWDPRQYERFKEERRRPFFDLLAGVKPGPDLRVVDLGCGTGELTRVLHERLRARETLGIDGAETMLAESASFACEGLRFERREIRAFVESAPKGSFDLLFSNAALHWIDDHPALFERLTGLLAPDGQLAVQVPANHDFPTHTLAAELAGEPPFREALKGYAGHRSVLAPEAYASMLHRLNCREQLVRLQVYGHLLSSAEEVVEWVKGTTLTAYRRLLGEELFGRFLAEFRARLLPRLGDSRPYFYPFKRILIWARK